jgi:glutathione S-transferase
MSGRPTLYGAAYSVYVRIARLALIEKGVDHELVPVDVFAADGPPGWYRDLHPFGRIPAFRHGDLRLFETTAIARYVDEAFDGPPLQPVPAGERAVMNQIVAMLDAYAYRPMVWGIYVERVSKARDGGQPDETVIAAALPAAETCLATLAALKRPGPFLLGERLTLADLHAAPIFGYFTRAPEGAAMLRRHAALHDWWTAIAERPAVALVEAEE